MPAPNPNATSSTFQVGTYTSLTDTFTSVFDLNDGVNATIMWNTLKLPQPEKAFVRSFNLRAPGERVTRFQYKNRHIQVSVSLRGSTVQTILNTCHSLIAAIENPPYRIRFSQPNATQYTYATVVAVTHNIPADPQTLLAKALPNVQIDFECLPGLLGDRVTLSNLVTNPGFEAPSGPAVPAFSDGFGTVNAYATQSGGAPTLSPSNTFVDIVQANGGSNMLRYYRLGLGDSASAALDIAGTNATGTPTNSPTQGAGSLVSSDTDTAYTLTAASSQYVDCPTTGLPTGNNAISLLCRFKFPSNPAGNSWLMAYGAAGSGAHNVVGMYIDSAGKLNATCNTAPIVTSAAAVTTNVNHTATLTWDGTTLTLYLDGASAGTATPGANTIPTSSLRLRIGATADTTAAFFWNGQIDECMVFNTALSSTQVSNIHTAANTGATGTVANAMSVPAASRQAFGSPAWGAYNIWQERFRYVTGLSARFYLHYTDANNWLRALVISGALSLQHSIAGVVTTVATSAPTLQHEAWYWLQVTQFPAVPGNAPYVQATLFYDNAGAVGTQVTNGSIGPVATADAVTALVGRPQIEASAAALVIGGAFSGVHSVSLFAPGGWSYSGNNGGTGTASLGWEQNTANTYPNGPVTSYGAARIDCPPAGTPDARLSTWDGTGGATGAAQYGIPATLGQVLGLSVAYKTTAGLSATSAVQLLITEYTSAGAVVGVTATPTILNGTTQTSWATFSTTYTVLNGTCAFVKLGVRVFDSTANSANATVWFDNVQLWNQTTTGQTSMPYCELRFPQSPAQWVVSGLLGDMAAPAFLALGSYFSTLATGTALTLALGRRGQVSAAAQLVGNSYDGTPAAVTPVLDATSYGGYYLHETIATGTGGFANVLCFSPKTGDALGTYHAYNRAWIAVTGTDLAKCQTRIVGYQQHTQWAESSGALYAYYGTELSPIFTNSSTWTPIDNGQVSLPVAPQGALSDPSATYTSLVAQNSLGTNASGEFRMNWAALMPVDTETPVLLVNNPGNGAAYNNQWLWVYLDGAGTSVTPGQIASTYSLEATALANPGAGAGGVGTQGTAYINVNSLSTPYVLVDPTQTVGGVSVNQLVAFLIDGNGSVLGLHGELRYTPLYLYPR